LVAVPVAYVPGDYKPSAAIRENAQALRDYLVSQRESQKLADRLVVLWASSRFKSLLTEAPRQKTKSDGYGTELVAFAL